jgi:hypothetical protein
VFVDDSDVDILSWGDYYGLSSDEGPSKDHRLGPVRCGNQRTAPRAVRKVAAPDAETGSVGEPVAAPIILMSLKPASR